jgi:hypothetical protein
MSYYYSAPPGDSGDIRGASRRDPGQETCEMMSLLPLKKRASNDFSRGGGRYVDSEDYPPSRPPKKRRADDDCISGAERTKNDGEAGGSGLSVAEKLRLSKGKSIAAAETNHGDDVAPHPPTPVKKLMHDGIRSGARFNEVAAAAAEKKQPRQLEELVVGEEVQRQLRELGATQLRFVHRKRLEKSDVCTNQNRLLVSRKRESLAGCAITACFTPEEWRRVEDKHVGLVVPALDREGGRHALTCKYLVSNESYRFITGWSELLKHNGLVLDSMGQWTRDVEVQLWAFRSRALPKQPALGPDGKKLKDGEEKDHLHPEGSLGILLLHREQRGRVGHEAGSDGDEPPPVPVARFRGEKKKKQGGSKQRGGDKRADAGSGSEVRLDAAATMSKAEMTAKFGAAVSNAVIGMMGLRDAILRERQKNVVVGGAT